MPAPNHESAPNLEDYLDFLSALDAAGVGFAIIGGCAVGAFARLAGETVVSADLDICVPQAELEELLTSAVNLGAVVEKRPEARQVPVALLRWRGLEINALTSSTGLPPVEQVILVAHAPSQTDAQSVIDKATSLDEKSALRSIIAARFGDKKEQEPDA